jgi:hypothetical protein
MTKASASRKGREGTKSAKVNDKNRSLRVLLSVAGFA